MAVRRAAKIDANQPEIVKAFRQLGASVAITSSAHDGMTDIIVGLGGLTVLVEIKDGSKPPSKRKLTPDQVAFHGNWQGAITVVETIDQAIELVARMRSAAALINTDWSVGYAYA